MAKWSRRTEFTDAVTSLIERFAQWGWGPAVTGAVGGGGIFSWAASATDWLSAYGPIAWVSVGAIGAVVGGVLFWLIASARLRFAKYAFYKNKSTMAFNINPLEDTFQRQRININDFAGPIPEYVEDKTFIECELTGPAAIVLLEGTNVQGMGVTHCDFIKIRDSASVYNVIPFKNLTIRKCRAFNITFLVPEPMVSTFEAGFKTPVPWINP